jgi:hypothetical protein
LKKDKFIIFAVQVFILVVSLFLLNACSLQPKSNQQSTPKNNSPLHTKTAASMKTQANWKLPISIPEGEFSKVGGWLSDDELVYITNKEKTSTVYSYKLSSGQNKLLFKSEYPIGSVQISPSKENILIQAAPSSYEGKITIIDLKGNEEYSQIIPSYELAFEWNPYQESEVLVSKFQQDWTFQVLLVDFKNKITKELSLPQPFLKWTGEKQLAYLNWDNNNQKLFAPLMIRSLADGNERTVFPKVFQFAAFKNMIMTITVNEQQQTKAKYSFYDQKLQMAYSFSIPQLAKFSDWLVPFYDYNESKQQFITLQPLKSADADTYTEGFQLASYHLNNRKSSILFAGLANEPLALSPSGEACLYGNRFEKLMDLRTKKIINVVKE